MAPLRRLWCRARFVPVRRLKSSIGPLAQAMRSDPSGPSSMPPLYDPRSLLQLLQNRCEGESIARTCSTGDVTVAHDVLQGNVITVFQPPTEPNQGSKLLRA